MRRYTIGIIMVVLLGFLLRFHNYAVWPREGATFDEHAWTWLGLSILDTGVPTSWSPHPFYKSRIRFINAKGAAFYLVTPYLEHPPLFGLIAGSFAKLNKIELFGDIQLVKLRLLSLGLGVLSILLVYLLIGETGDKYFALLAAFLYAIIPTVVVGSRLIENENFFIPLSLLTFYLLTRFLKNGRRAELFLVILFASLAPLAKIPWAALGVSIAGVLCMKKKYNDMIFLLFSMIGFFLLYLLWGYRFEPEVFNRLWGLQLNRYDISFDGFFALFANPLISDRYYFDGWILFGWFSFVVFCKEKWKTYLPIFWGFLAYLGVYLAFIPNEPGHGWYRYPFYPFLAIGIAYVLRSYFLKDALLSFLALVMPGLSMLSHTWEVAFGFSYGVYRLFLAGSALSFASTLGLPILNKKIINICMVAIMGFVIFITLWAGFSYTEQ